MGYFSNATKVRNMEKKTAKIIVTSTLVIIGASSTFLLLRKDKSGVVFPASYSVLVGATAVIIGNDEVENYYKKLKRKSDGL